MLNLHWSVLFVISILRSAMGLPKTCTSREKSPIFSRFATQQGAISLFIFYSANLSNLWIVNNFSTNILFFFLAHCKFAHTWPVEMEWITRLNEQKQPGSYNYCECDTQINEPILKAKRMGQVNDATIEKRLALGLRKSFRWQQNYKQRGATFATLEK